MKAARFDAVIYGVGRLRCVDVPESVSRAAGDAKRVAVRVRVAGHEVQGSLVRRSDGGHRLFLPAGLRRAVGVDVGDRVRVAIAPDPAAGEPALPDDLREALRRARGATEAFRSRSPADRRQAVRWIEEAKSASARRNRIEKLLERIFRPPPRPKHRR